MARGEEGKVLNIKLSGDTGAHIPVELNGVKCLALIDTGASRSCMSSAQYKLIGSPPLEPLPGGPLEVTGTSMEAWGLTSCLVCIGRKMYAQSFIVCNKMMTNVIVGRDFLSTYKLSITWGDEGTMEVLEGKEPVIRTGEVHQYPAYVGGRARVPPRTVAAVPTIANLPPFGRKTLFRFVPLKEGFANELCMYPLDYATWRGGHQHTVQPI